MLMRSIRPFRTIGPSRQELRLQQKALLYWRAIKRDRPFVRLAEFDPLLLPDRSSHGFLVDMGDPAAPIMRHIGSALMAEAGLTADNIPMSDVPASSLLGHFADAIASVIATGDPMQEALEITTRDANEVRLRALLLPLSASGTELDHVYGLINWKWLPSLPVTTSKVGRTRSS